MELITIAKNKVWTIENFLTPEECATFIGLSEDAGYDAATITTRAGFVMRPDIRNNDRVIWDDIPLGEQFWERLAPLFNAPFYGLKPIDLNERFRFYRYSPGQRFAPHRDGSYTRENGESSFVTLLLYLNGDCEGGATRLEVSELPDTLEITPKPGLALLFAHRLLHEGAPVTAGRKYVLRTDVMYEPAPAPSE
jgi:prolyl 4-hydroxylase